MTDVNESGRRRPVPDTEFGGRLKDCFFLDLEVIDVHDVTPRLRSIGFRSADLVGFECRPGQDVMFAVPGTEPPLRRRYTIRRADPVAGTLDIEVVLHGDGPFARWARTVAIGDHIDGIGPRGLTAAHPEATHHVFVADGSAIPITFAMIEHLPAGHTVTALLAAEDGNQLPAPATAADLTVRWASAQELPALVADVDVSAATAAYVHGERTLVRRAVDALAGRGLPTERIASKAYWRDDQANAAHGEPGRDPDQSKSNRVARAGNPVSDQA